MNEDEKRKRKRVRKAYERLGTSMPCCSVCGESNPHCLEVHEPGGRRYTEVKVILCRNCHRKLSDDQRDHPARIWSPPDLPERLGHQLLGLADFYARLAERHRADGAELIKQSRKGAIPDDTGRWRDIKMK